MYYITKLQNPESLEIIRDSAPIDPKTLKSDKVFQKLYRFISKLQALFLCLKIIFTTILMNFQKISVKFLYKKVIFITVHRLQYLEKLEGKL